jgi:hypothetical protein
MDKRSAVLDQITSAACQAHTGGLPRAHLEVIGCD